MSIRERLPAFDSKDYRLWFAGQSISLIGTWMQNTGQSWLVLQLTNSPFKLGLLTGIQFLPSLALSLFIGPVIDRYPKRSILLLTQSLFAVAAALLAIVTFSGHAQYWQVLVIAAFTGILTAVDWPTRQAFVKEQVREGSAVVNALALNSTMFNIARAMGPGIGGALIAMVGIPWTFALNALSYVAVIISLFFTQAGRKPAKDGTDDYVDEVRDGARYIKNNKVVAALLVIAGVISLFLLNFNIFIPSFARLTLGLEADAYGGLMSALGIGALAAGLMMSLSGPHLEPTPMHVLSAGLTLSAAMVLLGIQHSLHMSGLLLIVCGFGMATLSTMCNTALQLQSPDTMRGRVMAAYNLVYVGSTPIGALYAGKISDALGADTGFLVSGLIGIAFLAYMLIVVAPRAFKGMRTFVAAESVDYKDTKRDDCIGGAESTAD